MNCLWMGVYGGKSEAVIYPFSGIFSVTSPLIFGSGDFFRLCLRAVAKAFLTSSFAFSCTSKFLNFSSATSVRVKPDAGRFFRSLISTDAFEVSQSQAGGPVVLNPAALAASRSSCQHAPLANSAWNLCAFSFQIILTTTAAKRLNLVAGTASDSSSGPLPFAPRQLFQSSFPTAIGFRSTSSTPEDIRSRFSPPLDRVIQTSFQTRFSALLRACSESLIASPQPDLVNPSLKSLPWPWNSRC